MARPKNRVRPLVVLTEAYISRIGRECLELHETIDRAAGRAIAESDRRELAVAAERLATMGQMFR